MALVEKELVEVGQRGAPFSPVKDIAEVASPFFLAGADGLDGNKFARFQLGLDKSFGSLAFRGSDLGAIDMVQAEGLALAVAEALFEFDLEGVSVQDLFNEGLVGVQKIVSLISRNFFKAVAAAGVLCGSDNSARAKTAGREQIHFQDMRKTEVEQ